jgi:SMC interacting uncharacterized protein involved in chromosome segregation
MTPLPSIDEVLARLSEIRIEIERHEAQVWCLKHEADQLRHQVRAFNAKTEAAA